MLEYKFESKNTYDLPELSDDVINDHINAHRTADYEEYLFILKEQPYIDAVYVDLRAQGLTPSVYVRFAFYEGNSWGYEKERLFVDSCLENSRCMCDHGALERIFRFYSEKYPEWKLDRYLTKRIRILDHIYNCFKRNTVKEMLYKAGLDELAFRADQIDEYDLLSTKPSDIYEGISMRALRSLNCPEGALLLKTSHNRHIIRELQLKYPDIFRNALNDSQCKYLSWLMSNDLTVGEMGRLYLARSRALSKMWATTQYDMLIGREKAQAKAEEILKEFKKIDPFYSEYLSAYVNADKENPKLNTLRHYLTDKREEYDKAIRRSNRKRDYDWQERNNGYVVRYPQTINDFCREVVYQCNCLLGYLDAVINNDTTILFMRKPDDPNKPFITIEIFNNRLTQAYRRFNNDCTKDEAEWIIEYCKRHGIYRGQFEFNNLVDDLM